MNKFKVIIDGKELTITAHGWQVGIGGYYIFFDNQNATVAIAPPTSVIGNANSIK